MRYYKTLALLVLVTSQTAAATYESSIEVSFPDELVGFTKDSRHEFPKKALGVNIAYHKSAAVRGSIYIYNAGLNSIPSGIESSVVQKHFEQVIDEVKALERTGKVRAIIFSAAGSKKSSFAGCGPQFIWQGYEMDISVGASSPNLLSSYTYLTAMNDNFVKLRVSYLKNFPQGPKDAEQFVSEIRKVLGKCK